MRLRKPELLNRITDAVLESGWRYLILDDSHPFRLILFNGQEQQRVLVYIWNITHGGYPRSESEYRIQVTGRDSLTGEEITHFGSEVETKTLILGWWAQLGVFAGWDYQKHSGLLGGSPSFQIRVEALQEAEQKGLSIHANGNQEVAVAFRPDFLCEYVRNLKELHSFGEQEKDLEILSTLIAEPADFTDLNIEAVSTEKRRTVLRQTQQRLRSSNFRERVLRAYGYRCAFCGLQLNLVQAAHVLPVAHEESTDATQNGVAACYLHHAAYDYALITFAEDYAIIMDEEKLSSLTQASRGDGSEGFQSAMFPELHLPLEASLKPAIKYIRLANHVRGWDAGGG